MNVLTAAQQHSVRVTHGWFEVNSGWAEPTRDALEEWLADRVCQCPDECWVAPYGVCPHGLASWALVLHAMGEHHDLLTGESGPLRHAPNFRDIGGAETDDGRRLRTGIVFRSGVLDQIDDVDRSQLRALGLRTVIDVRSDEEVQQRPNALPDGVVTLRLALHDVSASPAAIVERIARGDTEGMGAEMLRRGNVAFATDHRGAVAAAVRAMTNPHNWPVLVHCTAGKDRTGFAVAALLWALGVDDAAIVRDYLESNDRLEGRHAEILARVAEQGLDPQVLHEMLTVTPEYLDAGRSAAVGAYGSIDAWVEHGLSISADERRAWQSEMLA